MAKKLTGVDIIIGGDSHTLLGNFSNIGLNSISNEYPVKKLNQKIIKMCNRSILGICPYFRKYGCYVR